MGEGTSEQYMEGRFYVGIHANVYIVHVHWRINSETIGKTSLYNLTSRL